MENICIVFTKAYYDILKKRYDKIKEDLESEKELINQIIKYIEDRTEEISESNKNESSFVKIETLTKLPVFFVDYDLSKEKSENLSTKEEIKKLIEWVRTKKYK